MASYFFSFLNTLLPKTDQLSETTLGLLEQPDLFAEHFSAREYLSTLFPSMQEETLHHLATEIEDVFSAIISFIGQSISNDLSVYVGNPDDRLDALNFFVLASTVQAVCHPPFLHFLHEVMNKVQIRDFEHSSMASELEALMAKLSQNRVKLTQMFEINVQTESPSLMHSGLSAILLFAFDDVDACIELLDERLSYIQSLTDLFDLGSVGRIQRLLGSEQKNQAVVRRVERAFLANCPEKTKDWFLFDFPEETLTIIEEYYRDISYSASDVFDYALQSYKANQLVGSAHQDRIACDLTRSAEQACLLLRDQLRLLKKNLSPSILTESLQRLKAMRAILSQEHALLDQSARMIPVLIDPRTKQENKLFTRFVIQSITQAPVRGSQPVWVTFSSPRMTRQSIEKAMEKRQEIPPQYRQGIVHALSYFYLDIPERLESSPEKSSAYRSFFENWSMLQHHALINIFSTIHLAMIRDFESVESQNNRWLTVEEETVSALLTTLRENQSSLLTLNGASFGISTVEDMYRLFLFNVDHVMLKLVGILIRREAALSALHHFFETTAKTTRGKNVLRRLAKAVTVLLPKENQAIDGRIRALKIDYAEVKADALRRSIDVARRAEQPNPFKKVLLEAILQTNTTRHLAESFIGQLATLPWKEDIASLMRYRDVFLQAHPLRDATIFETLQSMPYFIRSSQDKARVDRSVVAFKSILPAYVNARLVYAWFLSLPQELFRLSTDGRELMLNDVESKIHNVFFPSLPLLWDHCDLLRLSGRIDDSIVFLTENEEAERFLFVRYSYTLAMYMTDHPERTRLRPSVTQLDLDQAGQRLLALPSHPHSPVLSVNDIKAILAPVFFPLTDAQIEFIFFEINTYRIQIWLSQKLLLELSSDREISSAFFEYKTRQHNNIIESVADLKRRFIRLIQAGYVGEWGKYLTDVFINTISNQANEAEITLNLMRCRLPKHMSYGTDHDYEMTLDRLEQEIVSSSRPQLTLNATEHELKEAISGLAKVITWHHRLQWAALPLEAFFSQDYVRKLEKNSQKLSALIETSLLAKNNTMGMRALRFRRWILVLENLLALGNMHGYQIVYTVLDRMRNKLPTAYSYASIKLSDRKEASLDAAIPPLFFSTTKEHRSVTSPLFRGLLPDQDLRHCRDFFSEAEAFYRHYVNNIVVIEGTFVSPDIDTVSAERLLSATIANASVLNNDDIIEIERGDARQFPQHIDMDISLSDTVTSVSHQPSICFMLNRSNITRAIEDNHFIDTMLDTAVSFTDIELLNTQLFRKEASFLVRLSRLFNTHAVFRFVKRFCISNNQRDYEQTVPLEWEQYIYTMQFIRVYLPIICRVKVFESQRNGLTGEFLSLLLDTWRSRPQGVSLYPLSHLSLHGNQLGISADGAHLLRELMRTISLTVLDVNQNSFGKHKHLPKDSPIEPRPPHQDAERIAEGIRHCLTLEELDIGYNDWGNKGSEILLEAIAHLPCLHTLKLSFCGMDQVNVVEKFIGVIERNSKLRTVVYDGNPAFTAEYSQRIDTILLARQERPSTNTTITTMSAQGPFSFFNSDAQALRQENENDFSVR